MSSKQAITVAITGASGSIYGLRTLEFLLANNFVVDLIFSEVACKVMQLETNLKLQENLNEKNLVENKKSLKNYLDQKEIGFDEKNLNLWNVDNLAASVSSGSYRSQGMIIVPCSMGALGRIANGTSDDLISRCADVCLKERSKLIIVARETPLNAIHLQNMLTITNTGGMIVPAMPAFYHNPKSIDEMVNFVVGKALDAFGIDNELFKRWLQKAN